MAKAVQKVVPFHQRQNEKIAIYNQPKFTIYLMANFLESHYLVIFLSQLSFIL